MKRQVSTMRTFAALRLGRASRLPISSVQYGHSGVRRWTRSSFGLVVAQVVVIGFSLPTLGLAGKKGQSPTVTILVFNHAQASSAILAGAEREAGRILDRAGLGAVWLDCLDRDSADPEGLCHKAREPIDVVLRILPSPIRRRFRDTSFGFAILPVIASVYYEYVVRLAKSEDALSVVLGCAIAHEVGHLLLGPNGHSMGGIMQGEWGPKQVRLALMGGLLFTSQQSKIIQAEARTRMTLRAGTLNDRDWPRLLRSHSAD